jgi:hypothetical protein
MQFFYGPTGTVRLTFSLLSRTTHARVTNLGLLAQIKYLIAVTLHWEEGTMREGERFKEKLNTPTAAGPLSVLSYPHHPHSLPHHHPPSSTTAGSYGSSHPSSCTFYGEDGPHNPSAGNGNAHYYWDQVLQSLATPTSSGAHRP